MITVAAAAVVILCVCMSRPRRYTAQRVIGILSQYNESETDSENEDIPEDLREQLDRPPEDCKIYLRARCCA